MGKYVECPFCGRRGEKTKEHVWAQWLHDTPGATALLSDTHGERIARFHDRIRVNARGRYETFQESPGPYAKWLPNVTVLVCTECNSGWMSRLEGKAKEILGPFFATGHPVRLSVDDLVTLATWVTKSWMAYALTKAPEHNPFTHAEYRSMAAAPGPLKRSRIWLLHSQASFAQVAMGVATTFLTFGDPPDLSTAQDNTAFAYFAAATVVLYMAVVPPDAPIAMMDEVMRPKAAELPDVRQIWPAPRAQYFPLDVAPDAAVRSLLDLPTELFSALGLPVEGLSAAEIREVRDHFLAGADPTALRENWATDLPDDPQTRD